MELNNLKQIGICYIATSDTNVINIICIYLVLFIYFKY